VCLDVGTSTGGFAEVLVARGARRVYAVDVGTGQLHPRLRERAEIVSFEQTDIRALDPARLAEPPNLVTIDVSFISLKAVLPSALALAARRMRLLALIKPQFELTRRQLKKGIVRDPVLHVAVCSDIRALAASLGLRVLNTIPSVIIGGGGNAEFFIGAARD
jgi:23S rRNA (cytidine1920-2'-O)/16S rRNA (cytidine1409-2'-O)-methyltransferase